MSEYPDDIISAAQWSLTGHGIALNFGDERKERILNDIMRVLLSERKHAFEEGFKSGFMASAEGWNGEHPGIDYDTDADWTAKRDLLLSQFMELDTQPSPNKEGE